MSRSPLQPAGRDGAQFLVLGASGQTGKHFLRHALDAGHRLRALVRNPDKLALDDPRLEVRRADINTVDAAELEHALTGVDYVVCMLGDRGAQQHNNINTAFVARLVPAMRAAKVRRFLYQAGGLSSPPEGHLPAPLWAIKKTLARSYRGQHRDNEAVMTYLHTQADDIEWIVHRAGIGSDGPSKGTLQRANTRPSIATFTDCAAYNLRTVTDTSAIHTWDFSRYEASE